MSSSNKNYQPAQPMNCAATRLESIERLLKSNFVQTKPKHVPSIASHGQFDNSLKFHAFVSAEAVQEILLVRYLRRLKGLISSSHIARRHGLRVRGLCPNARLHL